MTPQQYLDRRPNLLIYCKGVLLYQNLLALLPGGSLSGSRKGINQILLIGYKDNKILNKYTLLIEISKENMIK